GFLILTAILVIPFITPLQNYLAIPNDIVTMHNNDSIKVPKLGTAIDIKPVQKSIEAIDTSEFKSLTTGADELVYEVAGIPIKKVSVSILEDVKVIPGGQSIGVQLHTLGVLVVGHHLVNSEQEVSSPGEEASIK